MTLSAFEVHLPIAFSNGILKNIFAPVFMISTDK